MTQRAIEKAEQILHSHENPFHIRTAFFDQKIKTLFTRFDMDNNGKIEKEDFENWSNRLIKSSNLNEDRIKELKKSIIKVWEVYFLPADTNHDGSVEFLELLDHMKSALRGDRDDENVRKAILETLPLIFQAIDTNGDGQIASEEFQVYFESFGITNTKFAIEVFKEFDTNHDLIINQEEFVKEGTDFFMGFDSTKPSRFFFGPLV